MDSNIFDQTEFAENPEPRCPVVLVLDTSGSMQGKAINELNEGLRAFAAAARASFDNSAPCRLALAETCAKLGIPLVHGAIGGWYGHVVTQFPGEDTVQKIYSHWVEGKGIEKQLGNPAFTPAVVASLEVAEVCKVLLGTGKPLRRRKLSIDLLEMEIQEIHF